MRSRDRKAAILIAATLAVSAFAVGSALRWAACLSAALALVCALPYLRSSRRLAPGWYRSPLLAVLGLAIAFALIQVLPLPAALVSLLSPARYQLAADNAAALGEGMPALIPLSLDPPATLVELAKYAGYAALAAACLRLSAAGARARGAILGAVALVGVAIALTALGHRAVGASSLFGLYEPELARPAYLSPFLNPNHLSAFLALAAAVSVGLAFAAAGHRRLAWLAAALVCAGVALLAGSRGGALALLTAASVAGGLVARRGRRRERGDDMRQPRSTAVAIGIVAACAIVLLAAFTADRVATKFAGTTLDEEARPEVWAAAAELIRDYPATGVGRGAFIHAFPRVYESRTTFAYLENGYLQAVVDWGIPAAAALAVALALLLWAAARRALRAGPLEAGALGGLAALAVHNSVDFNLELPGVALAAIAVAACLLPPTLSRPRPRAPARLVAARAVALAAAAAAIALAAGPPGTPARAETRVAAADEVSLAAAERAFRRHPSDFLAAGELARAMLAAGDPRALRVANRALYLNPTHGDLHRLAARILLSSERPEQALVHYGLALEHGRGRARRSIVDEIVTHVPEPEVAARGLPADPATFSRIARSVRSRHPKLALPYARRIQRLAPDHPDALLAIADIERRLGDPAPAVAAARRAHELRGDGETAIALAEALAGAGDHAAAAAALEGFIEARKPSPPELEIALGLADIHEAADDLDAARDILAELTDSLLDRRDAARVHRKLAGIERALGNDHRATWHRDRARRLAGN